MKVVEVDFDNDLLAHLEEYVTIQGIFQSDFICQAVAEKLEDYMTSNWLMKLMRNELQAVKKLMLMKRRRGL